MKEINEAYEDHPEPAQGRPATAATAAAAGYGGYSQGYGQSYGGRGTPAAYGTGASPAPARPHGHLRRAT